MAATRDSGTRRLVAATAGVGVVAAGAAALVGVTRPAPARAHGTTPASTSDQQQPSTGRHHRDRDQGGFAPPVGGGGQPPVATSNGS